MSIAARSIVATFLLSVALGAGCVSLGGGPTPVSRELGAVQFNDVPVPGGFVLVTEDGRSWSYSEGGSGPGSIRMGHLEYTGKGDIVELVAWYETQLLRPLHGWTGVERLSADDDSGSLVFERPEDRCVVSIRREGPLVRIVVDRNPAASRP
jgi:hypothetical protein